MGAGGRPLLTHKPKNELKYSRQSSKGKTGRESLPSPFLSEMMCMRGMTERTWTKVSSSERPQCAMAVTWLGNAQQLCTGCSWVHASKMSSCGCGKRLVPCNMSSNKLSQLFNCRTNSYFLWLNTLSLNYPSENPVGPNEAIICKSTDEEIKHKDKQYFQEFGSNLSGIFPSLRIHC